MSDAPENLMLTFLRRIDAKLDRVVDKLHDLKSRVTSLELSTGQMRADEQIHYAGIMARFDRNDVRLDRIERRLDLVSTADA